MLGTVAISASAGADVLSHPHQLPHRRARWVRPADLDPLVAAPKWAATCTAAQCVTAAGSPPVELLPKGERPYRGSPLTGMRSPPPAVLSPFAMPSPWRSAAGVLLLDFIQAYGLNSGGEGASGLIT
jgi:hypothetical protein